MLCYSTCCYAFLLAMACEKSEVSGSTKWSKFIEEKITGLLPRDKETRLSKPAEHDRTYQKYLDNSSLDMSRLERLVAEFLNPRKHLGNKISNLSIPSIPLRRIQKDPKGGFDFAKYNIVYIICFHLFSECPALGWRKHQTNLWIDGTRQVWVACRCRWSQRLSTASMDWEVAPKHVSFL